MSTDTLVITNRVTKNIVIVGDNGVPRVTVLPQEGATETVEIADLLGNTRFCTDLAAYVNNASLTVTRNGVVQTASRILSFIYGDTATKIYYGGTP